MKNLTGTTLLFAALCVFGSCGDGSQGGQAESDSDTTSAELIVADPSATSLVKRGMVVVEDTPRKLKGPEGEKDAIYRFHPFDNDQQRLRLTKADNNAGKGIAEDMEIELAPYANRMVEVQGSSFTRRWVYNARINEVVEPDTLSKVVETADSPTQ